MTYLVVWTEHVKPVGHERTPWKKLFQLVEEEVVEEGFDTRDMYRVCTSRNDARQLYGNLRRRWEVSSASITLVVKSTDYEEV